MGNDLIRLACEQATRRFGVADTFNGACFAAVFAAMAGLESRLDGNYVRAMLTGRPDVEILAGSAHYRLLSLRLSDLRLHVLPQNMESGNMRRPELPGEIQHDAADDSAVCADGESADVR